MFVDADAKRIHQLLRDSARSAVSDPRFLYRDYGI
jgi:hypothetical protein